MSCFFDIHVRSLRGDLRRGINKIPFGHVQDSPQVVEKNYRIAQKKVIRDLGLVFLLLPRQNGERCKDIQIFFEHQKCRSGRSHIFSTTSILFLTISMLISIPNALSFALKLRTRKSVSSSGIKIGGIWV